MECDIIGGCGVGQAVITNSYNLPSKFIIHTAGPVWQGGDNDESELLASSYRNSLELAQQYNC
jgi:O-acetyl-ADP-ribose deacetylase (regulator of RNase III)